MVTGPEPAGRAPPAQPASTSTAARRIVRAHTSPDSGTSPGRQPAELTRRGEPRHANRGPAPSNRGRRRQYAGMTEPVRLSRRGLLFGACAGLVAGCSAPAEIAPAPTDQVAAHGVHQAGIVTPAVVQRHCGVF